MPRRKSPTDPENRGSEPEEIWSGDDENSVISRLMPDDESDDKEIVEDVHMTAKDGSMPSGSTNVLIVEERDVHQMSDQSTEASDKPGLDDKRNLSLEALFQAAHSELQNFSKQKDSSDEEETDVQGDDDPDGAFTESVSNISDVDDSVSIVIQTATGEKVTGKLVKVINNRGQEKIKVKTSNNPVVFSQMQLVAGSPLQTQSNVVDGPLGLDSHGIIGNNDPITAVSSVTSKQTNLNLPSNVKLGPGDVSRVEETHTGGRKRKHPEKPGKHVCPYCSRRCAKPSVLVKHIRAHTGERPYPCIPCGFSFKTKSNLYKHCKSRSHAMKVGSKADSVNISGEGSSNAYSAMPDYSDEASVDDDSVKTQTIVVSRISPPYTQNQRGTSSPTPVPLLEEQKEENVNEPAKKVIILDSFVPTSETTMVLGQQSAKVAISPMAFNSRPVVLRQPTKKPNTPGAPSSSTPILTGQTESTHAKLDEDAAEVASAARTQRAPSLGAIKKNLTPDGLLDHISWLISSNEAIIDTPMAEAPRPKRVSVSRQASENNIKGSSTTPSTSRLSRSSTDPTSGRRVSVLQRQASVCEVPAAIAPNNMLISLPNQPGIDAPNMLQLPDSQQMVFLGLAEPSDQPPGSASVSSGDCIKMLPSPIIPSSTDASPTSMPSEIRIQFKLPKKQTEDGPSVVAESYDSRDPVPRDFLAAKRILLQEKNSFASENVKHFNEKAQVNSSTEREWMCLACGFDAVSEEDLANHRVQSCPKQGLLVVLHEDGTEETVLVSLPDQMVDGSSSEVDTPGAQAASTSTAPPSSNEMAIKSVDSDSVNKIKPDLKLSIPGYMSEACSLPTYVSTPTVQHRHITPEPDSSTPSAIPDWKLQLKGHLLMKRSLSEERLLSEEKEEKNKLQSLQPNLNSQPLKRSRSLDPQSEIQYDKKRILPEINQSPNGEESLSEDICKLSDEPINKEQCIIKVTIQDTSREEDQQSLCSHEPVVNKASEMMVASITCSTKVKPVDSISLIPPTLSLPASLAEKIPGFLQACGSTTRNMSFDLVGKEENSKKGDQFELKEKADSEGKLVASDSSAFSSDKGTVNRIEDVTVAVKDEEGQMNSFVKSALMLLGNSYPSTHSMAYCTFCSVLKPQPCYVEQGKNDKISMYSNWKTAIGNANIMGLSIKEVLSLYQLQHHDCKSIYAQSQPQKPKSAVLTHSSYWSSKDDDVAKPDTSTDDQSEKQNLRTLTQIPDLVLSDPSGQEEISLGAVESVVHTDSPTSTAGRKKLHQILVDRVTHNSNQRVKICPGGYKSNEDYVYVRGRGRGKYVCEECGIRCKKPSMLKKHIRTHTDFRPYKCQFCCFKFKTKGNLTKHMKSKAHRKRCLDLGISPVPVFFDASNVDADALTDQDQFSKESLGDQGQMSDAEEYGDGEEDDDEEEELEQEDVDIDLKTVEVQSEGTVQEMPHYLTIQSDGFAKPSILRIGPDGQAIFHFDISDSANGTEHDGGRGSPRASIDKEIAASLLDLSKGTDSHDKSTTFKSCAGDSRLTNLIGALISRTTEADTNVQRESILPALAGSTSERVSINDNDGTVDKRPQMTGFLPPLFIISSGDLVQLSSPQTLPKNSLPSDITTITTQTTAVAATATTTTSTICPSSEKQVDVSVSDKSNRTVLEKNSVGVPLSEEPKSVASSSCRSPVEIIPVPGKVGDITVADTETGRYKCNICETEFSQAHQLTLHRKIHQIECLYKCSDCSLAFRTEALLNKHLRSERHHAKLKLKTHFGVASGGPDLSEPRPFKCDDCRVAFRFHGHLAKHLRSRMHILELEMHGKLPAGSAEILESMDLIKLCTLDSESNLKSIHNILKSVSQQSSEAKYICEYCSHIFDSKSLLDTHLLTHESQGNVGEVCSDERGGLVCSFCTEAFTDHDVLAAHTQQAHGAVQGTSGESRSEHPVSDAISCASRQLSERPGPSKQLLLTRMRRLTHMCEICGDAFTNEQDLLNHVSTHSLVKPSSTTELRPYVCEFCDGGFSSPQSLRIHLKTHKEERPYVCGTCGATFASSDLLKQHSSTHVTQPHHLHFELPKPLSSIMSHRADDQGHVLVNSEETVVEDGVVTDVSVVPQLLIDSSETSHNEAASDVSVSINHDIGHENEGVIHIDSAAYSQLPDDASIVFIGGNNGDPASSQALHYSQKLELTKVRDDPDKISDPDKEH